MKNIKTFCKDHKKEIVVTGLVIGGVIATSFVTKRICTRGLVNAKGLNVLTWKTPKGTANLEYVKKFLDANAGNGEPFAIFKEGPDPDAYVSILFNDKIVQV
jgi:esterase/lipase